MFDAKYEAERQARYERETKIVEAAEATKADINAAFRALRKQGLIARQNYKCCQSCASYEIGCEVEKKKTEGKLKDNFKGAVFTTRQDPLFTGGGGHPWLHINRVYLKYGAVDTEAHGELGLLHQRGGGLVAAALTEAGVSYEWDGDPNRCIVIDPCPGHWPEEGGHSVKVRSY